MVTLDINDSYIALLKVTGKNVQLAASLALEPGLVKFGVIQDITTVGEQITQLMAAHHVKDKTVDVCVSSIYSIFRIISLPLLSGDMLSRAVRREVERIIAVPISEVYLFWQIVAETDKDMNVCALAIPKNTCDTVIATLCQAGLKQRFMTIRPIAIARLVNEENAIVVNILPGEYDIAIVVNGALELIRSVVFPSGEMPEPERMAIVIEDLEKTVSFCNSSHNQDIINRDTAIFITGEIGDLSLVAVPFRVEQLPNFMSYPADFSAAQYASCIGVALIKSKGYTSPVRLAMNIIPPAYLPRSRLGTILALGAIAIGLVIIASLGYTIFLEARENAVLQAQINAEQAKLIWLQADEQTMKKLQTQLDNLIANANKYTQPLENAREQREKIIGDLDTVTKLLPGTINEASINYRDGVIITGTTPDQNIVISYILALKNTNRFSSLILSNLAGTKTNQWSFTLEVK